MSRMMTLVLCAITLVAWTEPVGAQETWNGLFRRDAGSNRLRESPTLFFLLGGGDIEPKEGPETPIMTNRPDFVEASVNVPQGRLQIEAGYTFSRDRSAGVETRHHSLPEMQIRYGVFEWLELSVAQNWGQDLLNTGDPGAQGAEDTVLLMGINLTKQKGLLPESRIQLSLGIPTGSSSVTTNEVMPGISYLYGWEVTEKYNLGASTFVRRAQDDSGQFYSEWSQAVTNGFQLTEKLGMYVESFALFPSGARVALPQYYADSGFTYKFTPNFQVDIRAGIGLNRAAQDYFVGTGFAVRF